MRSAHSDHGGHSPGGQRSLGGLHRAACFFGYRWMRVHLLGCVCASGERDRSAVRGRPLLRCSIPSSESDLVSRDATPDRHEASGSDVSRDAGERLERPRHIPHPAVRCYFCARSRSTRTEYPLEVLGGESRCRRLHRHHRTSPMEHARFRSMVVAANPAGDARYGRMRWLPGARFRSNLERKRLYRAIGSRCITMLTGIIGARGFIGAHLLQYIASKCAGPVRVLLRNVRVAEACGNAEIVCGDLLSPVDCERFVAGLDVIYYLAHCNTPISSDRDQANDTRSEE